MESIIVPEPYISTGYTGHIPGARQRPGKTLSYLSHRLFLDPCTPHSPDIIVTNPNVPPIREGKPTSEHIKMLKDREQVIDAVYKHPLIPGYEGHIPRKFSRVGHRDVVAATLGVLEHQKQIDIYHCEKASLVHKDHVHSGLGVFELNVGERVAQHISPKAEFICVQKLPKVMYKLPLRPVLPRARQERTEKCDDKPPKRPYSKFPPPHFLDYEDPEKWIIYGYDGHIPLMQKRYGACNKQLTTDALSEFLKRRHIASLVKWCPRDDAVLVCPKDNRGADSRDCPDMDYTIYPRDCGMTPNYSGHVPGVFYSVGKVFAAASVNAKGYLEKYRNKDGPDDWECHCIKIEPPKSKRCTNPFGKECEKEEPPKKKMCS